MLAGREEADHELALDLGWTFVAIHTRRCNLRKRADATSRANRCQHEPGHPGSRSCRRRGSGGR